MLSVKQSGIKYHFLSLWYNSTWDRTQSPEPLANTLFIRPMVRKLENESTKILGDKNQRQRGNCSNHLKNNEIISSKNIRGNLWISLLHHWCKCFIWSMKSLLCHVEKFYFLESQRVMVLTWQCSSHFYVMRCFELVFTQPHLAISAGAVEYTDCTRCLQ